MLLSTRCEKNLGACNRTRTALTLGVPAVSVLFLTALLVLFCPGSSGAPPRQRGARHAACPLPRALKSPAEKSPASPFPAIRTFRLAVSVSDAPPPFLGTFAAEAPGFDSSFSRTTSNRAYARASIPQSNPPSPPSNSPPNSPPSSQFSRQPAPPPAPPPAAPPFAALPPAAPLSVPPSPPHSPGLTASLRTSLRVSIRDSTHGGEGTHDFDSQHDRYSDRHHDRHNGKDHGNGHDNGVGKVDTHGYAYGLGGFSRGGASPLGAIALAMPPTSLGWKHLSYASQGSWSKMAPEKRGRFPIKRGRS